MAPRRRPIARIALVVVVLAGVATGAGSAGADGAPAAVRADAKAVVLGRFSTSYAADAEHKARAFNVELAAEAIDGHVIGAGATFSFNDAVGERTAAFGFAKSVVIRDRMVAEGTGGGTCQVASTLYAAALLAGLDVVARAPHTRPSAYIRMGLDATVAYPKIDLKLRNPTGLPVVVHARSSRGVVEIWLDTSAGPPPDVSLTSEILERIPFELVIQRDRSLEGDAVRLKAFGIPGYRVRRTREIRTAGSARRDVRVDLYPPTGEILEVAPSFDEARLALPAGERPSIVADPAAVRPVLVQLRPSTTVTLGSAGSSGAETVKASDEP